MQISSDKGNWIQIEDADRSTIAVISIIVWERPAHDPSLDKENSKSEKELEFG